MGSNLKVTHEYFPDAERISCFRCLCKFNRLLAFCRVKVVERRSMIPVSTVVLTRLLKPLRALAVWRDGLFKSRKRLEEDRS